MDASKNNIVFTGFRASGKSLVGRILAKRLGLHFVDADIVLMDRLGATISEIVARSGWDFFRSAERRLLEEAAGWERTVLASGGGAVMHREAWERLRQNAWVIWLDADAATLCRRIQGDSRSTAQRPALSAALTPQQEVAAKLRERAPLYAAGSDLRLDATSGPASLVEAALHFLRDKGMRVTS